MMWPFVEGRVQFSMVGNCHLDNGLIYFLIELNRHYTHCDMDNKHCHHTISILEDISLFCFYLPHVLLKKNKYKTTTEKTHKLMQLRH